ncbi:nickel pincer cofactor biosynthesis protein LarC [Aminipila luticellarii]|uniref:Pyridinium-3,5-bisthiocarboxylic acid mononucleotide nickel insertion protein n=1 Tax=Aminipila luticellarii TaxID=2507160 RepID=A0A410PTA3_9FIRM|nr:nickel pincer cofactor biosynthesis protein LarC [Aminipila luticellarii]QAT42155.1 nickel pincer cofactor biosynthesis protein LarC [Aminipila luticellarii]
MSKILYLECYSGISGDMTVGALLDLGADRDVLEKALRSLQVGGYSLHFGRTKKCGIDAYDFDVSLEEEEEHGEHGEHQHHEHLHHHGHHSHTHRNIEDIHHIIDRMDAGNKVKVLSKKIFNIVAEAESAAHGIPVEEVHFHEVGAIDSIVDILSTAICIDNLGIDQVIVSTLWEGQGFVTCQHGIIPVPTPAAAHIISKHALKLKQTENQGEMVTPTGAAIAAALNSGKSLPSEYCIKKIGIGAGKKDFPHANILRAMIIETARPNKEWKDTDAQSDEMWKLETNMDDCSGEAMGFTLECLLSAGAADAWYTPAYMKKNRPAYTLQVLCREEQIEEMQDLIFSHTTTVGIRRTKFQRTVLKREIKQVSTPYGEVSVKVCRHREQVYLYPEYEDIKKICLSQNKEYKTVYQEIIEYCKLHGNL